MDAPVDVQRVDTGFSALQRAEIAEMRPRRPRRPPLRYPFQCSSTSRNC